MLVESERLKLRSNLLLSITETEPSFRVSRSELHAENYDINDDEVDGDGFEAEENERTATATIADVSLDEPKRKCKSKVDMIKEIK